MKILRYVRVSSQSQKVDRQVEEGDRTKYDFFLEEKVSGKTELFLREKGSIIKELVLEGKVDVVSIYSVDRISRNLKDLLSVIDFFHDNGVSLQIDNLGITTLVDGESKSFNYDYHTNDGCFFTIGKRVEEGKTNGRNKKS